MSTDDATREGSKTHGPEIRGRAYRSFGLLVSAIAVIGALAVAEGLLRLQQRLGPAIMLSGFKQNESLSNRFHHRRGNTDSAVDIVSRPELPSEGSRTVRILFLGDSWIETGNVVTGFADYVAPRLPEGVQLELINGGTTSFSPSLILLQGELLISEHNPDIVVVHIDETDLMDEFVRYRPTSVFGTDGRLLAVVPDGYHAAYSAGLRGLEEQPLFVLRLVEKVYFERVVMKRMRRAFLSRGAGMEPTYEVLLAPQLAENPHQKFDEELRYFGERLDEMLERLTTATCQGCVVLAHHPHLPRLAAGGELYNKIVSEQLLNASQRFGTPYFDVSEDVAAVHGDDYARSFKWPDDKFSHLTVDGYRRYGAAIANNFFDHISAAWTDGESD